MLSLFVLFSLISASSDPGPEISFESLISKTTNWTQEIVDSMVDEHLSKLFEGQKQRIYPLLKKARTRYNEVFVYHAVIDWNKYFNSNQIVFDLESNGLPLDVYYVNCRNKTKLVLLSYNGCISSSY